MLTEREIIEALKEINNTTFEMQVIQDKLGRVLGGRGTPEQAAELQISVQKMEDHIAGWMQPYKKFIEAVTPRAT